MPMGCHALPSNVRTPADAGANSASIAAPPAGAANATESAAPGEGSALHCDVQRATCACPLSVHATSSAPSPSSASAADVTSQPPSVPPSECHAFATSTLTATRRDPIAPTSHAAYTRPSLVTASSGADYA